MSVSSGDIQPLNTRVGLVAARGFVSGLGVQVVFRFRSRLTASLERANAAFWLGLKRLSIDKRRSEKPNII